MTDYTDKTTGLIDNTNVDNNYKDYAYFANGNLAIDNNKKIPP